MSIPARLHFCWIGPTLPWAYAFAVLSAAGRSGIAEIVLHHTCPLDEGPVPSALASAQGVRLSLLDAPDYLLRTGRVLGLGDSLRALYAALDRPVMRADLLRAAILYAEGGVYLDLDTITVAPLTPLLAAEAFVGSESIVWPDSVRRSRSPLVLGRHLGLDAIRKLLCSVPGGWRAFRHVERFYARSVNNAVMGAVPQSAFIAAMLREMAGEPIDLGARTALGPGLLQRMLARQAWEGLVVHPPSVFSPLAPEISRHWFRTAANVRLDRVLSAETRIVHWYASVRTAHAVAGITPDTVRRDRHRQLYSALVCAHLDSLPAGAGVPTALAARLPAGPDLPTQGRTAAPSRP